MTGRRRAPCTAARSRRAARAGLRQTDFCREELTLRIQHVQVTGHAVLVPKRGEVHGLLRSDHQFLLLETRLPRLLVDYQRIFHLTDGFLDRLLILDESFFLARLGSSYASHFKQLRDLPMNCVRPSSVRTHGRLTSGG